MASRRGTPLEESYFKWLIKPLDQKWDISFELSTLRKLHSTEFEYFVGNDRNRAADGIYLREEFLARRSVKSSTWEIDGWFSLECSLLEMLIALANHASYESGDTMADWMFTFLTNMRISERPSPPRIRAAIQRLNNRTYSADGRGGLFPLRDPLQDQTQVELWYQLSAYIVENYEGRGC